MTLACQKNSYLKEFRTTVKSCQPAQVTVAENGKKTKVLCFEVILDDTILFPEGGGQPDDRGTIGEAEVVKVERRGATAVHYALTEVATGSEVRLSVDWERRFDHMQQHTGQHLLTAVADSMFGYKTTSWNLGDPLVSIELDTASVSPDQLNAIEVAVNEKIRSHVPVIVHLYHDKNDPELKQFRARGLPDDHEGSVRVLEIEGVDSTLCCGTHVSNLSHLQAIKILGCEKGKKNKCNLLFVAGGRLLKYLGRCYQVERELTGILKGPLDKHSELADKAIKGYKSSQKVCQLLLKDLAMLEAEVYKSKPAKDPVFCHFSQIISQGVVCFVCVGDDKENGLFTLAGPQDIVAEMGPKLAEVLDAKGAVTGGRYRGKASKMGHRARAEKLLYERVNNLQISGE
ncbi:hypothetical protein BaRGS_00026315, partial [Batillaria attramentaria]